jgi:hypothetical protein
MSEPHRTPKPNRILAQPATVQACAADLRTPGQQTAAAGAARTQLAEARMNAAGGHS